jgi:hypothetical protein
VLGREATNTNIISLWIDLTGVLPMYVHILLGEKQNQYTITNNLI